MTASQYQRKMKNFISDISCNPEQSQIIYAALGIAGEAGEFVEIIKKNVFHEKEFNKNHAIRELGDICWYVTLACNSLQISLEDVFQTNIDKLNARYSSGHFTVSEANNRSADDI